MEFQWNAFVLLHALPHKQGLSSMNYSNSKDFKNSPAFQIYNQLTMPPGAMQKIFEPVLKILAQTNQRTRPFKITPASLLFAGDHGVAKFKNVSAFPQEVTAQMLLNFAFGGAAMNVLSSLRNSEIAVCDVGVATPYEFDWNAHEVKNKTLASGKKIHFFNKNVPKALNTKEYSFGCKDISEEFALSPEAYEKSFQAGKDVFESMHLKTSCNVVILGEMGIGNTTPAAAIISQCLNIDAHKNTGIGTGIDNEKRKLKGTVIAQAVSRHNEFFKGKNNSAHDVVRSLGGFEFAAMAGAAQAAAAKGVHIILDGVIATAAVLPLALADFNFKSWLIGGHLSAEPAHMAALQALEIEPILNLNLRLGEGSGAALALGIMQDALAMLNNMATFKSAGVSAN